VNGRHEGEVDRVSQGLREWQASANDRWTEGEKDGKNEGESESMAGSK
jgi:hypothetical protein